MLVNLRIRSRAAEITVKRLGAYARTRWPRAAIHSLARRGLQIVTENSPMGKTKQLKNSWRIEHQTAARKVITSDCEYASYVEEGIGPSPGRYVPVIERRLVKPSKRNPNIGTHPGFPGRWFVRKSAQQLKVEAQEIFNREVNV